MVRDGLLSFLMGALVTVSMRLGQLRKRIEKLENPGKTRDQ